MSVILKQILLGPRGDDLSALPETEVLAYESELFSGTPGLRTPYYFGTIADPDDQSAVFLVIEDLSDHLLCPDWNIEHFVEAAYHLGAQQAHRVHQWQRPGNEAAGYQRPPVGSVARYYQQISAKLAILDDPRAWQGELVSATFLSEAQQFRKQLQFLMKCRTLLLGRLAELESEFPTSCHGDLHSENLAMEKYWQEGERRSRTILFDLGSANTGAPGGDLGQMIFNGAWRTQIMNSYRRRPAHLPSPNPGLASISQLEIKIMEAYKRGFATCCPIPVSRGRDVIDLTHRLTTVLRFGPPLAAFLVDALANNTFGPRQLARYDEIFRMAWVLQPVIEHAVAVGRELMETEFGVTPPAVVRAWELPRGLPSPNVKGGRPRDDILGW